MDEWGQENVVYAHIQNSLVWKKKGGVAGWILYNMDNPRRLLAERATEKYDTASLFWLGFVST